MVAVRSNKIEVADYLLKHNANVNFRDKYRWTLLHTACYKGHMDMIKLLVVTGARQPSYGLTE